MLIENKKNFKVKRVIANKNNIAKIIIKSLLNTTMIIVIAVVVRWTTHIIIIFKSYCKWELLHAHSFRRMYSLLLVFYYTIVCLFICFFAVLLLVQIFKEKIFFSQVTNKTAKCHAKLLQYLWSFVGFHYLFFFFSYFLLYIFFVRWCWCCFLV